MLKLRELREKRHLTQVQVGMDLSISQATVSGYENSATEPDIKTLILLGKYFDVSVDYLIGASDVKRPFNKSELTAEEYDSLNLFKQLSKTNRAKVIGYMTALIEK